MRPNLDFEVLDWTDDRIYILKIRVFGTDHKGQAVDEPVVFHEPIEVRVVHQLVAKMNNNNYR